LKIIGKSIGISIGICIANTITINSGYFYSAS